MSLQNANVRSHCMFLVDLPPAQRVILYPPVHLAGETPVPIPSERGRCTIWPGQYTHTPDPRVNVAFGFFWTTLSILSLCQGTNIWIPSFSHSAPCLCLMCSCCRDLYNGPVCCRMLFLHYTKPKRIWCYRSICPHCKRGRENGYGECKIECRIAVSLWATKSALGTGVHLSDSRRVEEQVPKSLLHPAALSSWISPRIDEQSGNTDQLII